MNHPEGIAVNLDGNIWCGGEWGENYRIDSEGSWIEQMVTTEVFTMERLADGNGKGNKIRIPTCRSLMKPVNI